MNYLKEILAFQNMIMLKSLSPGQIALWYALMAINNKCGWTEWFASSNQALMMYSGLSISGINKARKALKDLGLIDYRFKGKAATKYKMNSVALFEKSNNESNSYSNSLSNSSSDSSSNSSSNSFGNTLYKQNKKKQNKTFYNTRKNKFNNYEDDNKFDYEALEEEIINRIYNEC